MRKPHYDRKAEDLGNAVGLEHVNLKVPDQRLSTLFYITGLGLTRDPYLVTGVVNMWINVGRSQFHLPTGEAQRLRGRIGLVLPDLKALAMRLEAVKPHLDGTLFAFKPARGHIDVTGPWGNRFRCHAPNGRFGRMTLGMPYVQFDVPAGAAQGIARFYGDVLQAPTMVDTVERMPAARISVGYRQELIYRESKGKIPAYDGHHLQLYVVDFSGPHAALKKRKLITEESDQFQYRFTDIVDPKSGKVLYQMEHEIRSLTHPLYARPLINRNPEATNQRYAPGHEERSWAMPTYA
jgi:hypothetical protein